MESILIGTLFTKVRVANLQEQHLMKERPSCEILVHPLRYPLFLHMPPIGCLPVLLAVRKMEKLQYVLKGIINRIDK